MENDQYEKGLAARRAFSLWLILNEFVLASGFIRLFRVWS